MQIKTLEKVFSKEIEKDKTYDAEIDAASFNNDQGSITIEGLLSIGQSASEKELKSHYENLCKKIFNANYGDWEILKWKTSVSLNKPKKFGQVFSVWISFDAKNRTLAKLNHLIEEFVKNPTSKEDLYQLMALGEALGMSDIENRLTYRLNALPTSNQWEKDEKYKVLANLDLLEGSEFDLDESDFEDAWRAGISSPKFERVMGFAQASGQIKAFYEKGWVDMVELFSERSGLDLIPNKPFRTIYLNEALSYEEQERMVVELEDIAYDIAEDSPLVFFVEISKGDEFTMYYEHRLY